MAAETTTATLSAALKTYYVDQFLTYFGDQLGLWKLGQEASDVTVIPANGGITASWYRYHPLAKVTSAGTEGQTSLTYKALTGFTVTGTAEVWYDVIRVSDFFKMQSRDTKLENATKLLGQQAGASIEQQLAYILGESCITPLPAYAVGSTGVVSDTLFAENAPVTSAGSTTTFKVTNALLGNTQNSSFVGGWAVVTKGAGYGFCSRISTYASATVLFTLQNAAPEALQSATSTANPSYVTIANPFNTSATLSASNVITTQVLQKAEGMLFKAKAKPFPDGYYRCVVDPDIYRQLMNDTDWKTQVTYGQNSGNVKGLEDNDIGTWSRIKFTRITLTNRYASAVNTYNSSSLAATGTADSGSIRMTLVMGQDAFGIINLSEGTAQPEIIIKNPGPNDTSNPLNLYSTAGWKFYWKAVPLNANYCIGIFSWCA